MLEKFQPAQDVLACLLLFGPEVTDFLIGLLTGPLYLLTELLQQNLLLWQLPVLLSQCLHFFLQLRPLTQKLAVEDAEHQQMLNHHQKVVSPRQLASATSTSKYHHPCKMPGSRITPDWSLQ